MNLNKKIGVLLDNGFKPEFISSLNESKINFLFEKMSKRKENKEQTQPGVTTTITTEKVTSIDTSALSGDKGVNVGGNINLQMQGGKVIARQMKEGEISEKFESKAQQGLFWARCNKCKDDDCKWCKMAKEFSKNTSEKQYKTMPKKKETNEEFTMANYFDKVASVYSNNVMGKAIKSFTKEQILNKHLTKLVETNIRPNMKKRDLLRLIENISYQKKSMNEDFYFESEMGEDFDMMSMSDERPDYTEVGPPKRPDYTEVGPPKRIKPIRREPDEKQPIRRPKYPKASYISDFADDDFTSMSKFRNEPATKEPLTKPKPIPTKSPEKTPERRRPKRDTPYEQPETRPQGEEDFDVVMERLYNRLKRK